MQSSSPACRQSFETTLWSMVLRAKEHASAGAEAALDQLCATYWYPLYAYIRRRGYSQHAAEDVIQEFFARLLARDFLKNVGPEKGRFRTLLLTALDRFLCDANARSRAVKRGGGIVFISRDAQAPEQRYTLDPIDSMSADRAYERCWALTILDNSLKAVEAAYLLNGQNQLYAELKVHLLEPDESMTYAEMAARLGLSEGAVKMHMLRLRRRFQLEFRRAVAETLADPAELESEIGYLVTVFSRPGRERMEAGA